MSCVHIRSYVNFVRKAVHCTIFWLNQAEGVPLKHSLLPTSLSISVSDTYGSLGEAGTIVRDCKIR
jgi:hypothetical protein